MINSSIKILTLILVLLGNKSIHAQTSKHMEINISKISNPINVSSDSLWKIVSNPDLSIWSTLIDSTTFFGPEKFEGVSWSKRVSVVNSKGHHESHEDLISYDNDKMEIRFSSTKKPKFIISNETFWKVIPKGPNQCVLKVVSEMELKPFIGFFMKGVMTKGIEKNGGGVCYDIKIYAEKGTASPPKLLRMEELQKVK